MCVVYVVCMIYVRCMCYVCFMYVLCIVCVANDIYLRLCKVLGACYDCLLRVGIVCCCIVFRLRVLLLLFVCALFDCFVFGLGMQFVPRIRCFYATKCIIMFVELNLACDCNFISK